MKKLIFISIITLLASLSGFSQKNYDGALGLRFGYLNRNLSPGITGKFFLSDQDAIEGILGVGLGRNSGWLSATALYERHAMIFDIPELNVYYGAGGGFGVNNDNLSLGADVITGVEYTLADAPLNFSFDIKPYLNIVPDVGLYFNSAFSIRYTFK